MTLVELLELNNHYHSQSGNGIGTDKEFRHKYCSDYYDRILPQYKDKEITLLEVGTGHGGSLILWNDYFPKATIYGVDVGDMTDPAIKQYNRINTLIGDAYNKSFAETLPDFDIAIDDGPHTLNSFLSFLDLYLPKVKEGGLLVIEDIPSYDHNIPYLIEKIGDLKYEAIDTREQTGLYDNISFIVYK
jgi:cephalosporin hydroxylase